VGFVAGGPALTEHEPSDSEEHETVSSGVQS